MESHESYRNSQLSSSCSCSLPGEKVIRLRQVRYFMLYRAISHATDVLFSLLLHLYLSVDDGKKITKTNK